MALSIAARSCAVLGQKVRRYQGIGVLPAKADPFGDVFSGEPVTAH